jgi:hypothetical protein
MTEQTRTRSSSLLEAPSDEQPYLKLGNERATDVILTFVRGQIRDVPELPRGFWQRARPD